MSGPAVRRRLRGSAGASAVVIGAPDGATRVHVDGRTLVVRGARAWIRLP